MKFYLSGGMEYKTNLGSKWRDWITEKLQVLGHGVVDPVKLETIGDDGVPIQKKLTTLKLEGKLDEVRTLTREALFRKDMLGIQISDAIVVYYDESVQKGAGTLSEAWESFREGRPVYVVTEFSLEKVPSWLIGETTAIFSTFDEFLTYVSNPLQLTADRAAAIKIRDEVLAGIY